ncbi:MAG: hypothetical protein KDI48_12155 [Xanthomonadales bacterium]|nr:hypothetical protein [Xanthomonadales bacterium]
MNQEATLPSRWLAGLIGLVSVLTIAAMAHHPVAHGEDLAARLASMARVAPLAAGVHGGLITLLLTLLWLLGEATRQLVLLAPLRRAGTLAWSIGAVLQTLAALVNGFAVPGFAAAVSDPGAATIQLLQFSWQLNQALANAGSVALLLGVGLWSIGLCGHRGMTRTLGGYGVVSAAITSLALLAGWLKLDVHGMLLVVVLLGLWQIGLAVLLWRQTRA